MTADRTDPRDARDSFHITIEHHTAQAMCSEGIAASSFACEASAPVCQEPIASVAATTSVKPGEHPRRRDRVAPEDDEGDQVGEHQRVAQRAVDVSPLPPQPAEQPERDDEVRVVVVVGEHQAERAVGGEPVVEAALRIDVQRALEREHRFGVMQRGAQAQRREVVDRVVDPQQPADRRAARPTSAGA